MVLTSSPVQKARPWPVRMTARSDFIDFSREASAAMASNMGRSSAFSFSGLARDTRAIPFLSMVVSTRLDEEEKVAPRNAHIR